MTQCLSRAAPRGFNTESALALISQRCSTSEATAQEKTVSRVILLTDGQAKSGNKRINAELAELATKQQSKGITTSTICVGEGYDEETFRPDV